MADEPLSLSSTFPNPPPFWKDFTSDRIARIEELRSSFGTLSGLPAELANLQPPPEPVDGRWRVFGDQYMLEDKLPTLEEQGITNLPAREADDSKDAKHHDRAFELKKLAKSLLLNFLELAGILSRSPAGAEAKMADLRTLFINIHHILNEYRPHQARESAIATMQLHLERTRAETEEIRVQLAKAKDVLKGLAGVQVPDGTGETVVERGHGGREHMLWQAADGV